MQHYASKLNLTFPSYENSRQVQSEYLGSVLEKSETPRMSFAGTKLIYITILYKRQFELLHWVWINCICYSNTFSLIMIPSMLSFCHIVRFNEFGSNLNSCVWCKSKIEESNSRNSLHRNLSTDESRIRELEK